eukprot:g2090.t1
MGVPTVVKIVTALFVLEIVVVLIMWATDAVGGLGQPSIWLFVAIPPISGLVGYATNVIALVMTFAPLEFVGPKVLLIPDQPVGLFGWQGIIPAKAGKMAGISVDLMLDKLFDVQEIFSRLNPTRVAQLLAPGLREICASVLGTVGAEQFPRAWAALPAPLRAEAVDVAAAGSPAMLKGMLAEMKGRILEVLDVRAMSVRHLTMNKQILIDMFKACGKEEFIFIERSGWYFGFLFGVVQMIIYAFYDAWWVLPVFGFVVGYATNAIALKMIFQPIERAEYRVCPCLPPLVLHGLFLKRQNEVSVIFARKASSEVMTSRMMWDEILRGPNAHKFEAIVRKHVGVMIDRTAGADGGATVSPALDRFLRARGGGWSLDSVKDRVADLVIEQLPAQVALIHAYTDEALDLQREMREKMQALSSREFEGVLHPVFEEDEIKLILVGAALGFAVGCFQQFVMFKYLA